MFIFFLVTFLVVAILAVTNFVSKHALKSYTEDQIKRINWDAIVYQTSELDRIQELHEKLAALGDLRSVGNLGSVRLRMGQFMKMEIGGVPVPMQWCLMMAAEDMNQLPPELRLPVGNNGMAAALLGPQSLVKSSLDRVRVGDRVVIVHSRRGERIELFSGQIDWLTQPERFELVKWFLSQFGSAAFIPEEALVLTMPKEVFDRELLRMDKLVHQLSSPQSVGLYLDTSGEGAQSQAEPSQETLGASMIVEVMHLISMDRGRVFTGWDVKASAGRVSESLNRLKTTAEQVSFDAFANSELLTTLEKMSRISDLIGLLTILISVPILWMAWLVAGNLAQLIVLNQRRLVGLLRLRGASSVAIRNAFLLAIGTGGMLGGLTGIVVGTLTPYGLYRARGVDVPVPLLFTRIQDPWVLVLFVAVGTAFGLLAGRKIITYFTQITPLEASRRVVSSEGATIRQKFIWVQMLCLLVGATKLLSWLIGFTPKSELLRSVDNLLNFIGAPLFLYGVATLFVSRHSSLQGLLEKLTYPLMRELNWFAVRNMLVRPHRIMILVLVASLTFGVVVYPQITSNSFYDKALRGLRLSLGSEMTLIYDGGTLMDGEVGIKPVSWYTENIRKKIETMKVELGKLPAVDHVTALYEIWVPGSFYIPGKNYLQLYLVEDPDEFQRFVYYADELGTNKRFRDLLAGLKDNHVIISQGLASSYSVENHGAMGLGQDARGGEIALPVIGATYLLPGARSVMVQNRESYGAANIEFLNSVSQSDPYVVGWLRDAKLRDLNASLASVVLLVKLNRSAGGVEEHLAQLSQAGVIPKPAVIRSEAAEKEKLSTDMFVYLALENIKVFLVGGLLVALAGIVSIAVVNFLEEKRGFGLLRLRGIPPGLLMRIVLSDLLVPLILGAFVGIAVGLLTGYGLTNAIFALPRVISFLEILPVHLIIGWKVVGIILIVIGFFLLSALVLSLWVFRKTAREAIAEI